MDTWEVTVLAFAIVVALALLVELYASWSASGSTPSGRHFRAEISRSVRCDAGGGERVSWSFSEWHADTLIGRTFGRFCIARARKRFDRLSRGKPVTPRR